VTYARFAVDEQLPPFLVGELAEVHHLPASRPPGLPASRPPGLPASRPPGLPASRRRARPDQGNSEGGCRRSDATPSGRVYCAIVGLNVVPPSVETRTVPSVAA
jgi:hypothetical protein